MFAIWITVGVGVLIGLVSYARKAKVEFKNSHVLVSAVLICLTRPSGTLVNE